MEVMIDPEKSSLLRVAPRVMQILRVLARHKFLRALLSKRHWPPPKVVRETLAELGLTFLKFGQVLAMRHFEIRLGGGPRIAFDDRFEQASESGGPGRPF